MTAPAVLQSGTLADAADEDWIQLEVAEEDAGKTLRAFTSGGSPLTDTQINIYFDNPDTPVAESGDQDFHETVSLVTEDAGTYWVQVFASQEFFNPAINTYEAAVYLAE